MSSDLLNGAGHISQVLGAVGAQRADIFGGAHGVVNHRPLAGLEFKGQAHGLQRQQQVGKDDGCVHAQLFSGGDGDLGGQLRLLADLHQRVVLADVAILLHVAAGLAKKPHRRAIHRPAQAGANKTASVEDGFGGGPQGASLIGIHIKMILTGVGPIAGHET